MISDVSEVSIAGKALLSCLSGTEMRAMDQDSSASSVSLDHVLTASDLHTSPWSRPIICHGHLVLSRDTVNMRCVKGLCLNFSGISRRIIV